MTYITTTLGRYAAAAVLALALIAGALAYRTSVYGSGHDAGTAESTSKANEERILASRADALAATRANALAATTLKTLKDSHDKTTASLRASLAASAHRNQRLDADVARLLDAAAGVDPGPPGNPGVSGVTPGTAQAAYSVGDLIQTANENYAICLRNSAQLAGLQAWYKSMRSGYKYESSGE